MAEESETGQVAAPAPAPAPAPAAAPPAPRPEPAEAVEIADEAYATDDTSSMDERMCEIFSLTSGRLLKMLNLSAHPTLLRSHPASSTIPSSMVVVIMRIVPDFADTLPSRKIAYKFPNDEFEMDRLDLAHAMMVKAMGSVLFRAPLKKEKVHRILDIGTGTGIWAVEMGDIFENAEHPPNVKFEIDDIEESWVGHKKYDFIFCRYMGASIKDWPNLMKNIYDNLAPGGWAEFQDVNTTFYSQDDTYSSETATAKWMNGFMEACSATGRDPSVGPKLEGWVRDAQFANVVADRIRAPLGPWPKDKWYSELGMMNLILTLNGLEALSVKLFSEMLGKTQTEIAVQLALVRKELKSNSFHAMFDIHVVYGQKPAQP
ncbi:umta methyltransferase family protein [Colletotrichum chrysophilum]|uniref:Umta methyltransferase family protein n=1 Tax=Colletotrichum chrysophilum TaxID=1836956 RepID=A0AAD9ASZ9_9PEZI|nr:umta methyltransferase family protein [Colletotrichum chrysophilum]